MFFISKLKESFVYEKLENQDFKRNILVVGNIGNGKSTLLNKLVHFVLNGHDQEKNLEVHFEGKNSTKSVTTKVDARCFKEYRFIDSPGFGDP